MLGQHGPRSRPHTAVTHPGCLSCSPCTRGRSPFPCARCTSRQCSVSAHEEAPLHLTAPRCQHLAVPHDEAATARTGKTASPRPQKQMRHALGSTGCGHERRGDMGGSASQGRDGWAAPAMGGGNEGQAAWRPGGVTGAECWWGRVAFWGADRRTAGNTPAISAALSEPHLSKTSRSFALGGALLEPDTEGHSSCPSRDRSAWGHRGPGSGPSTPFSRLSFHTREPVYSNVFNFTTLIFNSNSQFRHVLISLPAALRGVTGGRGHGHCEGSRLSKGGGSGPGQRR